MMFTRIVITLSCLLLLILHPCFSKCAHSSEQDLSQQSLDDCCESGGVLIWERWLNGELKDYGFWSYAKNKVSWLSCISSQGGMLKLLTINYPLEDGVEYPEINGPEKWYKVTKPGVMTIFAQEYIPGEIWIFQNGHCGLIADVPFDPSAQISYDYEFKLSGKWSRTGELTTNLGYWGYLSDEGMPMVMISTPGSYPYELDPKWRARTWVNVPIPEAYGCFYGLAHAVGEVWSVTIEGTTYSATAKTADTQVTDELIARLCR